MFKSKITLLISIVSVFLFSSHVIAANHELEMLNKLGKERMVFSKKIISIDLNDDVLYMDESNTPKPRYYNEDSKAAIYRYREQNRDEYNDRARNYYAKRKLDPEWRKYHNERCRINNKRWRDKHKKNENVGRPIMVEPFSNLVIDDLLD